jgi:5-methylcytosine-specific restriction endonuclease McrA
MLVHGFVDEKHVKRERQKARELRQSPWWKQKLREGRCHYCEQNFPPEELTMDHKTPLSRGGTTSKGNVVAACKSCNNDKKYYTPAELVLKGLAQDQG